MELDFRKASAGMMGAQLIAGGCAFRLWAPYSQAVKIRLESRKSKASSDFPLQPIGEGHFVLETPAEPGDRYFCILDQHPPIPDSVSRLLPDGVHGPTQIVDPAEFCWTDAGWRGLPLKDHMIYELHAGTFTSQGTVDAAIEKLSYLKRLGVSVVELMPVAAFPGRRNWGYDGVSLYAVQASYGGPDGLRRLVDAAHGLGLGVMLDVVYNHLGHEGNYLRWFGPYFTARHQTPWGEAVNYDQEGCAEVRRYVIENALYWIREYHLDGLRLDAVQTIHDESSPHILAEIASNVKQLAGELGREVCVIAETDENDAKLTRPPAAGGYGLDAVWSDDFHHAVHTFFTGERRGYYQDFGRPEQIVRALNEGFVFQGEPFRYWQGRARGTSSREMPFPEHIICLQNHDQVGNRAQGERLTALIPRGARMLAAALLLLAPQTPLVFMGQEFDESRPFQYFTDYGDPALQRAVSEGRRNEFKDFDFQEVPDPQDPATFERSKLNWNLAEGESAMLEWYAALLALRRKFVVDSVRTCKAALRDGILTLQVPADEAKLKIVARIEGSLSLPLPELEWEKALSADADGFAVGIYVRADAMNT